MNEQPKTITIGNWNIYFNYFRADKDYHSRYSYLFRDDSDEVKEEKITEGFQIIHKLYKFVRTLEVQTVEPLTYEKVQAIVERLESNPYDCTNLPITVLDFDYKYERVDLSEYRYYRNYFATEGEL